MSEARTYLDYNASAPLRPEARAAMVTALDAVGNPSSVHAEGRRARAIVEAAREDVAALAGARPSEVVFTSGATEANAWAISGFDRVVAAAIEHDSVLAPARRAAAVASGRERFTLAPVSTSGVADLDALAELAATAAAAGGRTLVSLQMANNETGVLEPVREAAGIAHDNGHAFHTDAVQALGRIPVDFNGIEADFMSLSSHKIGGPKGVGALIVRDGRDLAPLISGGGQERRRRGGTENVAAIAGFGAAAKAAGLEFADVARIAALRDRLERDLLRATSDAVIAGAAADRLANTACIALPGQRAETLVIKLDLAGVAISAGAACSSGKVGASHVLAAMGLAPELAESAIRVSLGHATTENDIAMFLAAWTGIAAQAAMAA